MLALYLAYLDDDNDKRLFEDIYLSYRKQMVTLALAILKNKDDAEDAVGDVFLRIAQKNWDVVRGIKNKIDLRNYLLKATKNTSLNKIKANRKDVLSLNTVPEALLSDTDLTDQAFWDAVCNKAYYDTVLEVIESLNEKYRDAMYYHYVLELSIPQTAKSLNQTIPATKQQLVRGKKMLIHLLERQGADKYGDQ